MCGSSCSTTARIERNEGILLSHCIECIGVWHARGEPALRRGKTERGKLTAKDPTPRKNCSLPDYIIVSATERALPLFVMGKRV